MGKFDLDLEFTNIIEVALVAGERGNTFRSYIRIHYSIPKRVKELTIITDRTLDAIGRGFNDSMTALVELIHNEQLRSATGPIITVVIYMISQSYSPTV